MGANTNPDILGMSDEDFAKMSLPPASETVEPEAAPVDPPEEVPEETEPETPPAEDPSAETEPEEKVEDKEDLPETKGEPAPATPADPTKEPEPKKEGEEPPVEDPKDKEDPEPAKAPEANAAEYEAFFKKVMAPFKANGKLIQLTSADEVIQLMQMGANYTKKMQSIQPYKKYLMMLENNGLLDENKLSFYIDLEKKNPEAIKKFLKESNIDPVDVDTSSEVNYKGGAHAVTDQEVTLKSVIEDVKAMPGGVETIQSVNAWDPASKNELWENPELLSVIHAQRDNGIYATITAEMERRRTLGQISHNVPFLRAYKIIGDELAAKGVFQNVTQPAPSVQPPVAQARTPVAVRPAKTPPTKPVDPSKVRAAAAPRTVSRPTRVTINPLAMSDEEFMKIASKV